MGKSRSQLCFPLAVGKAEAGWTQMLFTPVLLHGSEGLFSLLLLYISLMSYSQAVSLGWEIHP